MNKEHTNISTKIVSLFCILFFGIWYPILLVISWILKSFGFSGDESSNIGLIVLGVLIVFYILWAIISELIYKTTSTADARIKALEDSISNKNIEFEQRELMLQNLKENFECLLNEKRQSYPWMAQQFADFNYVFDKQSAQNLKHKSHPALVASQKVSDIAREKRELLKLCKMYEYQLNYYETIFPWLEDYKECDPIEEWENSKNIDADQKSEYDIVKNWLSPQEYQSLPTCEKYQLALDRYIKRSKTNWQIGIEFERYIGYLYENKGYKVKYQGALLGLEDMGRDLIADNGKHILVIQCKRWAKEKTIHEKHIFQLYGSMVLLKTENPKRDIKGVFISTTKLSSLANKCAEFLGIEIKESHSYKTYPMIKCHISNTGEKIYHLPFDQQYDRTMICINDGSCYVETVREAEQLGFRRAFRWKGNNLLV